MIKFKKLTSQYINVCHVGSKYSLLLAFISGLKLENTLFLLEGDFEQELLERLDNVIQISNIRMPLTSLLNVVFYNLGLLGGDKKEIVKSISLAKSYITQGHLSHFYFFKNKKYKTIEDGTLTYINEKHSFKGSLKSYILNRRDLSDPNINEIIITGILPFIRESNATLNKLELVNIPKNILTTLNYVFNFKIDDFEILNGKNILITQPFSEDGVVDEDEKIKLYKKYLNRDTIIKPHPRELTDYNKIFNTNTINTTVPLELILMNSIRPNKVITLNSTAVFTADIINPEILVEFIENVENENIKEFSKELDALITIYKSYKNESI